MNKILLFVFLNLLSLSSFAQDNNYNTEDGYVAGGYDVVEYFNNQAIEGDQKYTVSHDGVKYKFSKKENLTTFKLNPDKYVPQYGGWCAYAIGDSGEKVSIDPETFQILDGKLYLFYNRFFTNTLDYWNKKGPKKLREKADKNWHKK